MRKTKTNFGHDLKITMQKRKFVVGTQQRAMSKNGKTRKMTDAGRAVLLNIFESDFVIDEVILKALQSDGKYG